MALIKSQPFYSKMTLVLLMLSLIGLIIFIGQDIIVPLAFAILLAMLLLPVNNYLERKKIPRVFAIILSLSLSFIFIGGIIYFLSSQIARFMNDVPAVKQHLADHAKTLQHWITDQFNITRREQSNLIDNATEKMKDSGSGFIGDTFISITQALMVIILLPVYSFLILYYRNMINRFLIALFKEEHEGKVKEVIQESKSIVQGYMTGLIIEMGIVATINSAGFMIVGIKYAIFLGVLAAILNMIPYIGMLIASVFCMLITLTTSTNISDIIWVVVILTVVQFIDNNIIMPKVVSSKVKINALITILGVLIGGALAGVSGMFLSIPAIAILKVIFDRVDELKPWGILLGDDTVSKKNRLYLKLENMGHKFRSPAPLKPPTL
ncbi:MAG: AI-2E family transporter [Ferruginibacter sp.]